MKIFVVGGASHYADFIKDYELVNSVQEAEVVLFTGGEDVSPEFYGCEKHAFTSCNPTRDKREKIVFEAVRPNQLCVGVCRGLKLLAHVKHGELLERLRW